MDPSDGLFSGDGGTRNRRQGHTSKRRVRGMEGDRSREITGTDDLLNEALEEIRAVGHDPDSLP